MTGTLPKAVFDTTVLVSAFLKCTGVSGELLSLVGSGFALVLAPEIIAELELKLLTKRSIRRSAAYPDEEARAYCRGLEELADLVVRLPRLSGLVRDPNDDMIVAAAVAARADYLVSRDKDLLSLGSHEGISVVTPEVFRGLLRRRAWLEP